jgi:hypothetical protein
VTEVEVGLDEFELHQDGAVLQIANEVDAGVEQELLGGGQDGVGGGALLRAGLVGV